MAMMITTITIASRVIFNNDDDNNDDNNDDDDNNTSTEAIWVPRQHACPPHYVMHVRTKSLPRKYLTAYNLNLHANCLHQVGPLCTLSESNKYSPPLPPLLPHEPYITVCIRKYASGFCSACVLVAIACLMKSNFKLLSRDAGMHVHTLHMWVRKMYLD